MVVLAGLLLALLMFLVKGMFILWALDLMGVAVAYTFTTCFGAGLLAWLMQTNINVTMKR